MINNRHKLYNWNKKDFSYPIPFDHIKDKRRNVEIRGKMESVGIINGLVHAAVSLAQEEACCAVKSHYHLQIGFASTGTLMEEIFVEYSNEENGENIVQAIAYNPETGLLRGCIYDTDTMIAKTYKLDGTKRDIVPNGAAIWAGFLAIYKGIDTELCEAFEKVKEGVLGIITPDEAFDQGIAPLCWVMYEKLTKESNPAECIPLSLKDDQNQLKPISKMQIESGEVAPSKGKKFFSAPYRVFVEERSGRKVAKAKVDYEKYKDFEWVKPKEQFSAEELALIPGEDPTFTPSPEFVKMLDLFYNTRNFTGSRKIMQIIEEGGAGSGKSTNVRQLARVLQRPYVTYVCGCNDSSDELLGMILPCAGENTEGLSESELKLSEAIQNSSPEDRFDNLCEAAGLPTTLDCLFDTESCYKQITGYDMPAGTDVTSVYRVLTSEVMQRVKDLSAKLKSSSSEVKYEYMPTNIVKAIQNGWVLELQEATCLKDQSALSCLFDALERESVGVVNTIAGDIYRHPDFICITTQNVGYNGTNAINPAARSRLGQAVFTIEDPNKEQMMNRASNKTGVMDKDILSQCIDVYTLAKEAGEDLNCYGELTMRQLYPFVDAISRGDNVMDSVMQFIISPMTSIKEDQSEILTRLEDCELMEDVEI